MFADAARTTPNPDGPPGFRRFALASGAVALVGGVVTLVGWLADVQRLTDWRNDGVSMFPNTAMCAGASGAALVLLARGHGRAGRRSMALAALGGFVLTLALLTLFQHVTGVNLGIDTLLGRREWGGNAAASPMRMGPPATASFILIGGAILLLGGGGAGRRGFAAGLALACVALASLPLIGYLYGAELLYTLPRVTGIAMQTAILIVLIGMGIVASVPDHGVAAMLTGRTTAGITVRRLLLPLIVFMVGIGWLRVEGQRSGLYDTAFGTAARTVVEIALVIGLLRWAVRGVRRAEAALIDSEERLRQALAEAERASRLKDEFLATLSHELRTPMSAIMGWIQMIRRPRPDGTPGSALSDADLATGLEVIERNARLQSRIIEDLLDMSRIISGKVKLNVQPLDLGGVIQAAIDVVRPSAEVKGVRLQVIGATGDVDLRGDAARMQQVFFNLLSNAVKFTPKGGRVQVVLQHVNSHVEVSVSDSGIGIRPEFLPHVFERFRQQDAATTREYGGLGLGLAIVKQLVELHGGAVSAASAGEGRGATFTVHLPIALALPTNLAPAGAVAREYPREASLATKDRCATEEVDLSGVRVLVVDDERDARDLLRKMLEANRAAVVVAASAPEAMDLLTRHTPSVVVSDIGMPGEDGYTLIRRIRALAEGSGGGVPAIALTAFARSEDRTRAMQAGFDMHLSKPIDRDELIAGIVAVSRRGSGGAAEEHSG